MAVLEASSRLLKIRYLARIQFERNQVSRTVRPFGESIECQPKFLLHEALLLNRLLREAGDEEIALADRLLYNLLPVLARQKAHLIQPGAKSTCLEPLIKLAHDRLVLRCVCKEYSCRHGSPRNRSIRLVGAGGIEPPNGGIKIQSLW